VKTVIQLVMHECTHGVWSRINASVTTDISTYYLTADTAGSSSATVD